MDFEKHFKLKGMSIAGEIFDFVSAERGGDKQYRISPIGPGLGYLSA